MANKKLNFTYDDGSKVYSASFESPGDAVVQIDRKGDGPVVVYANIPGMTPTVVSVLDNRFSANEIFRLSVPAGLDVRIESVAEVTDANLWTE